jgi:pSer/pThr/pTyr-binding forkhead associated (FHA) protein
MYRLIFLNGRHKGRRVAVQQGSLIIGRDPACPIDLQEDDEVSHQHAQLEPRADGIWIKDLGALNKTEVNGQPVDEVRLKPGDRIEIGRTQFEFQPMEVGVTGARRRLSKVQVLTLAAIAVIFIVQGLFMFLQVIQSPVTSGLPPVASAGLDEALEPELQRALDMRVAESNHVEAATNVVVSVQNEVDELRAAVADLRGQLDEIAVPTGTVSAVPPTVPPTSPVAVVEAPVEEPHTAVTEVAEAPFPVREQPPPSPEVPEFPPERPTEEDPLTVRARQMLEAAGVEVARSNLIAADQLLERIQVMAPEFVPAYVERAVLYEKRAMLNKAGVQWALVMERSQGTLLYATAAAARQRLAQAEVAVSTTRKHLDERPVARQLPRRIRIVSVDRERFQSGKEFDEMRLVRVNLKPRASEGDVEDGAVEVKVTFYDRVIATGEVAPTRGTVPDAPLQVEGPWPAGTSHSVTATYILKKGFRQEEERATSQKRMYEGYRVRVFYRGDLQDEDAQPRTLLKFDVPEPPPDPSAPVPRR